MRLEYTTMPNDENMTLKDVLKKRLYISSRLLTKLKLNQKIKVENSFFKVNDIVSINANIIVDLDFEEDDETIPQKGNIQVLYEDEAILAVNKPANIVVHPCAYHPDNTLANYVKEYLGIKRKIRPINRLDNGTSGIVLFAKNEYIQERFHQMAETTVKQYIAVVYGKLKNKNGTINLPIARKENSIIEREVNEKAGQNAITHYEVLGEKNILNTEISIIKVTLETGRTHQIRVHMSHIGHPLVGDTLYGIKNDKVDGLISRQALHANYLEFVHPMSNKLIKITASLPKDLEIFVEMQ